MKIEMEDLSPVRKKLRIEIPREETQKAYEDVSKKIASVARVRGFRPGKAPMGLIRNRFRSEIKDELIQDLLPRSYDEAVKSKELKPLAVPQIEKLDFQVGRPLSYEAVFEVTPEFELAEYNGLMLQKKVTPVTDVDVDQVLAQLRENLAKFIPVDNRTAVLGDQLSADIEGTYVNKETGEPAVEKPLKEEGVSITLGDANTLPEFNDSLQGASIGEMREFVVNYPDDFGRKGLAGKSIRYCVTVRAIKEKKIPELDEEFVKELGQECDNLEQVRGKIREDIEHRRKHESEASLHEQAITQMLERNQFEAPGVLIERRLEYKLQQLAYDLAQRGLETSRAGINWQKVRDDLRHSSEREVRAALILEKIAKAENLEPKEEEIDQELEAIAKAQGQTIEKVALQYEKENRMKELRDRLRSRKALAFVLKHASIQEVTS